MACLECEEKKRQFRNDPWDEPLDRTPFTPGRLPRREPPKKEYFDGYTPLEREIVAENLKLKDDITINNHPDNEDLFEIVEKGVKVLKFADKVFNPELFSGYGRVILRKNITRTGINCTTRRNNNINLLTQKSFLDKDGILLEHTIFIVLYDFDLNNEYIELPSNSVLWFIGGSFSNGYIGLDGTLKIFNTFIDWDRTFINVLPDPMLGFAAGTTRYKRSDGQLQYFDGIDWRAIGTMNRVLPDTSTAKRTLYFGSTNDSSIIGDTVINNFRSTTWDQVTAPESSPLVRFNGTELTYRYWVLPRDFDLTNISFYSDGQRDDAWTRTQDDIIIRGKSYSVWRHENKQSLFDSQIKIVNADILN